MYVYRQDDMSCVVISKRQLPLIGGENLMMLMDLNSKGLVFDHPLVKGKALEEFNRKYILLSKEELKTSLEVSSVEFTNVLRQSVPCVGCRRSVERLYCQLMLSQHPTLDPVVITEKGVLTVAKDKIESVQTVCTLLHKHNILLNSLLENQSRNKKNSRCNLHSLDSFRSKPFSEIWKDVWHSMKQQCKEEIAVIEAHDLNSTLDNYLKKHKFCQDCRTKVEKAAALLVSDSNPAKEKGYVAALYSGIRRCLADKHIHLKTTTEFIDGLIKRAEPELNGSNSRHRERHAKTLEIAQEEVLTCIGMCIYERLRRIYVCLKEEENACQVLAAVAVHALSRNFDMAVEKKRGITNLELLYEEISRAERAKEQRKEQKKLKKKKKKNEKRGVNESSRCHACDPEPVPDNCVCSMDEHDDYHHDEDYDADGVQLEIDDVANMTSIALCCKSITNNNTGEENIEFVKDEVSVSSCHSCENIIGGCTKSIDGGYVSEPSSHHDGTCLSIVSSHQNSRTSSIASSPEGSEVACSDGFCNHEPLQFHPHHHRNNSCRNTPEFIDPRHIGPGGITLTLQQMLVDSEDENDGDCAIPDELIADFKIRHKVITQERENLRQNLRKNFDQLCLKNRGITTSNTMAITNKKMAATK